MPNDALAVIKTHVDAVVAWTKGAAQDYGVPDGRLGDQAVQESALVEDGAALAIDDPKPQTRFHDDVPTVSQADFHRRVTGLRQSLDSLHEHAFDARAWQLHLDGDDREVPQPDLNGAAALSDPGRCAGLQREVLRDDSTDVFTRPRAFGDDHGEGHDAALPRSEGDSSFGDDNPASDVSPLCRAGSVDRAARSARGCVDCIENCRTGHGADIRDQQLGVNRRARFRVDDVIRLRRRYVRIERDRPQRERRLACEGRGYDAQGSGDSTDPE